MTEDVDKQYHLTLQMFFSSFFPLKAEVMRTKKYPETTSPQVVEMMQSVTLYEAQKPEVHMYPKEEETITPK